ncbi:class I SAM-dependent methyltransferase [Ruminococcus sp. FC2018]|uniref:class I SAM-dependent methyltransferase n=1 Tax=Ruminococcus sp. FC2018 TaxID=1410617 RepID=UPI000490292D|nr:class I SAM-dependent methyltransferase [Ruminococcus sp. FC2018]
MFWDNVSGVYDVFEDVYNGDVNKKVSMNVASYLDKEDTVLELACGTGMITRCAAPACKKLVATDFSVGMLKKTQDNCFGLKNIVFRKADIMDIKCKDESFDKVIAGNVIHLLDDPDKAVAQMNRVCKKGGLIIIPTYINKDEQGNQNLFTQIVDKAGAGFKRQFTLESYKQYFEQLGYEDVEINFFDGRVPCAVAVLKRK